jgi:hypothetical protein
MLEGRDVPSTLTVTNTLDSGPGSLRDDIDAAHSGDTIVFDPGLAGRQITLTSRELIVNKNLSIQGLSGKTEISGALSHSRVFDVPSGVTVTLTNLAIIDGAGVADAFNFDSAPMDGDGAGILNLGTLTLHNCTVSGNGFTPNYSGSGGGIYNAGTLTITGSILSGNFASFGGGIFNAAGGTLSMTGSTLSGNTADSEGGGLYNTYRATATIMNCKITGNKAQFEGGGIYNTKYSHLAVGSTMFSTNTPDNIFGSYADKRGNSFS